MAKNDRWCFQWVSDCFCGLLFILLVAAVLFGIFCLVGCKTTTPTPHVKYTAAWVEYYGEPVNGIIGRTADGKTLVMPGYIRWAEGLAIETEELKARLEQERIAKLKSTIGAAP